MNKNQDNREYLSHVTLMILGENLDPKSVSVSLGLRATQTWRKGDSRTNENSSYEWGGWKKSLPKAQLEQSLSHQLAYWVKTLTGHTKEIAKLVRAGNLCALSCYIGSSSCASIIIPPELQKAVAGLGLELQLSFFANENGG